MLASADGPEDKIGAVQLSARLCGVSPPVTRRILITEQASLAQLHAALQVAFGWSDEHLYVFQIRGWQFGDPSRAIELTLAGGGVGMPLAAFGFEINEAFQYHYNLCVPWKIDCRIEARSVTSMDQPLGLSRRARRSTRRRPRRSCGLSGLAGEQQPGLGLG
jgi:Plasmid pRiA4b ORF-3-like protein